MVHEPAVVRKLCLYIDRYNPPYAGLLTSIISRCREKGISVFAAPHCAEHLKDFGLEESSSCSMALVLGGDGTILRGLGFFRELDIPVLGVNAGHLGFLATVEHTGLEETIDRISRGDYFVDTIPVLRALLPNGHTLHALNDFSINRSMMGGILQFDLLVDDTQVARIAGDGLVISTPFGSTAYSLSCGGPILDPGLPAILVAAICPHSLSLRPLVVSDDRCVTVRIGELRSTGPVVSADGSPSGTLREGQCIKVTRGSGSCMTVRFQDQPDYYSRLSRKMGWGRRGLDAE